MRSRTGGGRPDRSPTARTAARRPVREHEWQPKKARDLLKLLIARRGRPVARDAVGEALWPEQDPTKIRNRLSVALSTLRSVLDPNKRHHPDHYVRADHHTVALETDPLDLDIELFLHEATEALALRAAGDPGAAERLEYAEAVYAGDFLEEDLYADRAVTLREEARALYLSIARALAEDAAASGNHGTATGYLLRILERDAYDEHAHLNLVAQLARAGSHGEARRAYRTYVQRMTELEIEPALFPNVGQPRAPDD